MRGFTLVELLVVIVVMVIIMTIAAPSFASLLSSNRITGQANEFMSSLRSARSEAIRQSRAYTVHLVGSATGEHSVYAGVLGGSGATTPTRTVTQQDMGSISIENVDRIDSSSTFTYARPFKRVKGATFTSRGINFVGAPLFFMVCDSTDSRVKGRIVQVSASGKITLDSTSADCKLS